MSCTTQAVASDVGWFAVGGQPATTFSLPDFTTQATAVPAS